MEKKGERMGKWFVFFFPVTMMFLLAGCAGSAPTVDYDPSFALEGKKFGVVQTRGGNIDPLNAERIERAVTRSLEAKGYRSDDPVDFLVRYDVTVTEDVPSNFSFGFGIGSYGRHGGGSVGTSVTPTGDMVRIRIEMVDPQSGKVFWSAEKVEALPAFDSPESRERFWNGIVRELLEKFLDTSKGAG